MNFGSLFGFSDFVGLCLVIGLLCPGVVPITNAMFFNAGVSVLEACHGPISFDFGRIHGPCILGFGYSWWRRTHLVRLGDCRSRVKGVGVNFLKWFAPESLLWEKFGLVQGRVS